MKLRLTQKGFTTYTGQMGVVFFENGVSVGDVSMRDGIRMAAVMQCEWEDGTTASVSQRLLDEQHTGAPVTKPSETGTDEVATEAVKPAVMPPVEQGAPVAPVKTYTRDELAAIADTKGIAGLRVIAEPLNIKGNSIAKMIEAIIKVAGA